MFLFAVVATNTGFALLHHTGASISYAPVDLGQVFSRYKLPLWSVYLFCVLSSIHLFMLKRTSWSDDRLLLSHIVVWLCIPQPMEILLLTVLI